MYICIYMYIYIYVYISFIHIYTHKYMHKHLKNVTVYLPRKCSGGPYLEKSVGNSLNELILVFLKYL